MVSRSQFGFEGFVGDGRHRNFRFSIYDCGFGNGEFWMTKDMDNYSCPLNALSRTEGIRASSAGEYLAVIRPWVRGFCSLCSARRFWWVLVSGVTIGAAQHKCMRIYLWSILIQREFHAYKGGGESSFQQRSCWTGEARNSKCHVCKDVRIYERLWKGLVGIAITSVILHKWRNLPLAFWSGPVLRPGLRRADNFSHTV